jgi:hypothetical protein
MMWNSREIPAFSNGEFHMTFLSQKPASKGFNTDSPEFPTVEFLPLFRHKKKRGKLQIKWGKPLQCWHNPKQYPPCGLECIRNSTGKTLPETVHKASLRNALPETGAGRCSYCPEIKQEYKNRKYRRGYKQRK